MEPFLVLYCAGLVAAFAWALRSRYQVRRPQAPASGQQLGAAELAFLAGGPRRVVETAIARLVETGQIHVARNGVLTAASTASSEDPVQAAVLLTVCQSPSSVTSVVRTVEKDPAVATIGDRLVAQRLLVTPAQAKRARQRPLFGFYVLAAVGVLWSDDYLVLPLLLTALLVIVLLKRKVKARTVHGDQVLASIRRIGVHESNRWLHPAVALAGVGGAVALGGLVAFPDPATRHALTPGNTLGTTSSGGGGGGSGCSSWSYDDSGSYSSDGSSSGDSGGGSSCSSGCGGGCGGGG